MKIELTEQVLAEITLPAIAVYSFQDDPVGSGSVQQLPAECLKLLQELKAAGELTGKEYECTLVHRPAGLKVSKLLIIGAGKGEKADNPALGRWAGAAARFLRARGIHEFGWVMGEETDAAGIRSSAEGVVLADYDSDRYRSERNADRRIDRLVLLVKRRGALEDRSAAAEQGRIVAEAANFTRDMVNEPANRMTPTRLAEKAQEMAARMGLSCEVFGSEEIQRLKMGAFWAVAQGSDEPPRMIVVRYTPPDAPEAPVIGLVGKGITFDTGGISIKPSESMHEMKTDMAGGATMLGVMQAIAQLKPRVRVVAVVPATENMPSGKAYRPGDVITSMSGKTIEVLNTDAEGRMVLADALTYAKQLGCTVLIDAATLTGAVMVALGNITTGVFGWNKDWVNRVLASGSAVGEKMWQLPIDDDYRELYKSMIADIANTGGRYGGAITAAMFVGEFAGDTPWVHLDIAGTRWSNEEKPHLAKGPTGVPVRTLVHLLTQRVPY